MLVCYGLVFLGCHFNTPVTSQPARLSDRLPAMDVSENIYYSFFFFPFLNYVSKKICFDQSYGLNFLASSYYDLNFLPSGYSVFFASAEFGRIFVVELCWGKIRRKGEKSPVGMSQGQQDRSEWVTSCS